MFNVLAVILTCSRIYGNKGNHFSSDFHVYLINAAAYIFIMMRPNAVILPQAFFKSSFPCFFRCKRGTLLRRLGCRIRCRRLRSRLYGLASVFFAAARYQHKYIRHRYNDGNVKGTIDIARHIEKNTPFVGNVAYSQREFSYDNSLMELVRHTIEFIKKKPYGNKLLIKVKDEVKLVVDATPGYEPYDRQKIIEQNKKNTVRHAYFREYLALQRLCLLILQHQKHQIGTGSRQIYGILFDGAWLWEEYINSLIKETFYHPMNKNGAGAQRLFDRNLGLIYPDFISRNSEVRIIADAKYKPVDNISNRDYLQVLAYMFRFDAKTGYYLYPEAEGSDDLKLRMNCGSTYEKNVIPRDDISLTKHGLKIPVDALNYAEFSVRIKTCEQEFKSALNTM